MNPRGNPWKNFGSDLRRISKRIQGFLRGILIGSPGKISEEILGAIPEGEITETIPEGNPEGLLKECHEESLKQIQEESPKKFQEKSTLEYQAKAPTEFHEESMKDVQEKYPKQFQEKSSKGIPGYIPELIIGGIPKGNPRGTP